ncbi:hypothetical protein CEXT_406831 [Caerostris extrusa]|uniref:Uncharacterized protein n=1 Tax=Caerostris extrusa TaxID=172846 RepID=A0AAV4XYG2_CAEEX|nr:hypothetical protein CEXT_406831 [Caerostris extrusa]
MKNGHNGGMDMTSSSLLIQPQQSTHKRGKKKKERVQETDTRQIAKAFNSRSEDIGSRDSHAHFFRFCGNGSSTQLTAGDRRVLKELFGERRGRLKIACQVQ